MILEELDSMFVHAATRVAFWALLLVIAVFLIGGLILRASEEGGLTASFIGAILFWGIVFSHFSAIRLRPGRAILRQEDCQRKNQAE